jgi:uncharacterized membrane protein YdjX (TVP38/TMEM64 family)
MDAVLPTRRGREYFAIQALALLPFAVFGAAYFAHAEFATEVDRGVGLLARWDRDGLRDWAADLGPWAALWTTLLMVVQALAAPIPAFLVTATNSWLFGWVVGGALSIVQATLAALVCEALARSLGEPLVVRTTSSEQRARADLVMKKHGATAVLVARLMPFVPFDPISYAAGLARMPVGSFVWATLVGQIPAGMTYAYLAQTKDPNLLFVSVPAALLGLAVLGAATRRALRADA